MLRRQKHTLLQSTTPSACTLPLIFHSLGFFTPLETPWKVAENTPDVFNCLSSEIQNDIAEADADADTSAQGQLELVDAVVVSCRLHASGRNPYLHI